ncbi:MAG: ATP-binding cassette domain-containing protein [bacterium]
MLDLVGLDESRYRDVETYSTGMHQRVKVAMALVHDPDLVLLDEPTSGLDPQSRDALLDLRGPPARWRPRGAALDAPAQGRGAHLRRLPDHAGGRVRFAGPLDALRLPRPSTYDLRLARPCDALAADLPRRRRRGGGRAGAPRSWRSRCPPA